MSAVWMSMFVSSWVPVDGSCDMRPAEALSACRPIATLEAESGIARLDWAVQRACLGVAGWTQVSPKQAQAWRSGCASGLPSLPLPQVNDGHAALLACQLSSITETPEGLPFVNRGAVRACLAEADGGIVVANR